MKRVNIRLILPNKQSRYNLISMYYYSKHAEHNIVDISFNRNKTFVFKIEIGKHNMYDIYYKSDYCKSVLLEKDGIFSSLNKDTFSLVIDYLNLYDLYILSLTCKNLNGDLKEYIKFYKQKHEEIKINVNDIYHLLCMKMGTGAPKIHAVYEMYKQENNVGILLDGISKTKSEYYTISALCKYFDLKNIDDIDIVMKFYDAFKYNVKTKWLNNISFDRGIIYKVNKFKNWLFCCRNPYYLNDFIKITGIGKDEVIKMFLNDEMNGESIEYFSSIKNVLIEKMLINNKGKVLRDYIFNFPKIDSLNTCDTDNADNLIQSYLWNKTLMKNVSKKVRLLVKKIKKLNKGKIILEIVRRLDFVKRQILLNLLINEHESYLIDNIYNFWIREKNPSLIVHSVVRQKYNRPIRIKLCFNNENIILSILRYQIQKRNYNAACIDLCSMLYSWWMTWKELKE